MQVLEPPGRLTANPTLRTIHEVERILRAAQAKLEGPLTYAEIGRRMSAKSVRFDVVKTACWELARHDLVGIGSKGVTWVVVPDWVWQRPTHRLE